MGPTVPAAEGIAPCIAIREGLGRAGVANKSSQKVKAFLDEVFDDVFAREAFKRPGRADCEPDESTTLNDRWAMRSSRAPARMRGRG